MNLKQNYIKKPINKFGLGDKIVMNKQTIENNLERPYQFGILGLKLNMTLANRLSFICDEAKELLVLEKI